MEAKYYLQKKLNRINLLSTIIIIFISVLIFFNYKLMFTLKKCKQSTIQNINHNNDRNLSIWELESEGERISNPILSNFNNDTISLFSLLTNPKIIFRIPQESCLVCIDTVINQLITSFDSSLISNIIIITSLSSHREFKIFAKKVKGTFKVLRTNDDSWSQLKIERSATPYLAVVLPEGTLTHIFIPDKLFGSSPLFVGR